MPDDRDFIERAESITGDPHGEPMASDRIADNFALYGAKKRVAALDRFDGELHGQIDSGAHSLRRHVRLMELRRRLGNVHKALRKASR